MKTGTGIFKRTRYIKVLVGPHLTGGQIDGGLPGATDEWAILHGNADSPNIDMGTNNAVTGAFDANFFHPLHYSPPLAPATCSYAFGIDGAAQPFTSAVSKGAETFEVFRLDHMDNKVIRRKSYAKAWGEGSTMQSPWGSIVGQLSGRICPKRAVGRRPILR